MSTEETQSPKTTVEDLPEPAKELTVEEASQVKGGLPAIQKVREAAARSSLSATDD